MFSLIVSRVENRYLSKSVNSFFISLRAPVHRVSTKISQDCPSSAVTVVSRWLVDLAFASPPQSGLAWFCFLFPLIEPDRQISRIRLSEKTHAFAHGRFAVRCGNWTKPYTEFRDASGKRLYAGRGSLCLSHNHRRSLLWACISTAL